MNFLDLFAQKLREKREQKKITQRELAERLNMCTRTVIEIEKCKSNPKFKNGCADLRRNGHQSGWNRVPR